MWSAAAACTVVLVCIQLGLGQTTPPGPVLLGLTDPDSAGYALARASGIRSARITADWSAIEPQRGRPVWTDLDRAVATAQREGVAPLLALAFTPGWASIGTGVDLTRPEIYSRQPPRDINDWGRFVSAVAARYRDRVREWQVWTHLGLPHYRGTGNEYVALLQTAHARIRALDPSARVASATPEGMDLGFGVRMLAAAPQQFDALVVSARGTAPESLLRPLGILAGRARAVGKALWLDWAPERSGSADAGVGLLTRVLAVAQATGVERFFLTEPALSAADLRQAAAPLAGRPYVGYLARDPDVFAVLYGAGADAVLLAWTTAEGRSLDIPASPGIRVATLQGRVVGTEIRDGRMVLRLAASPLVVTDVAPALLEEARATATTRGALLPVVGADRDFSRSPEVFARLGRTGEERGLYNLPYRARSNGAVEPVETAGGEGVRTVIARGVVYVYFDLDDTFAFFLEGRTPLEITVEAWGSSAPGQVGFNLLYDSTGGYRFTPWQWVEVAEGWVNHTLRLTDASMANTWGWDLAINAGGNRSEDLVVRTVTVRKLRPP
ncbi:MAG: hypothetical protein FJX73_03210 [Armatimonadetes bacterium]|nr:hypothetical protein [Armatimonadota bacterium]